MAQKRPNVELTADEFAALWLQTIPAGKRDATLRDVLGVEAGRDPDDLISITADDCLMIAVKNIKRTWGSRERGYVYSTIEFDDPEEPGLHYLNEGEFIAYLVELGAPHHANMLAKLRDLTGKSIEIIANVNNEIIDE